MRLLVAAVLLLCSLPASAQITTLRVRVLDAHDDAPLQGASVRLTGTALGATSASDGMATVTGIPAGAYTLTVSYVGYRDARLPLTVPRTDTTTLVVSLEEAEEDLAEVVVSSTRTTRTIADTPTRVEVIGEEEIGEKINMDPSGLAMLLNESPGITVQQTSAVSANATFRIQGLDGRYTHLLRDGFPLYSGFAGGLSLLQIPPLDLAAVEVIKGPASTLYGGDAIAGIVNLLPKRPTEAGERSMLINGTTAGGLDAAGYYARRGARSGFTALVSGNLQSAYDAESDGFTNLPATRRLTVSPTGYRYGTGTLEVGLTATAEVREGGDMRAVRGEEPGYTERNTSERVSGHAGYDRPLGETGTVRIRSSGSLFRRAVQVPASRFGGRQFASASEASLRTTRGAHDLVVGLDLRTDAFDQGRGAGRTALDYRYSALGAFAQDTWDVAPALTLEGGLRVDHHRPYGTFVLPRAAVLVRPSEGVALRVSGGLGYKAPTVFLEASEARAFAGVQPLATDVRAERSAGANMDLNVRRLVLDGRLAVTFNQALFFTQLRRALEPVPAVTGSLFYANAPGTTQTYGSETTARFAFEPLTLFLGYVFLDAHRDRNGVRTPVPLTARHRTYTVLVWEQHDRFRVGVEAYYTGPQIRVDGTRTPGYLIGGLMGERRFGRVRAFVNFENVLDARQSRHSPLVTGPRTAPSFPDVWGPTDGFIANGGIKIDL